MADKLGEFSNTASIQEKTTNPKVESLKSLVRGSVIENYTPNGYGDFDYNNPLFHILGQVDRATDFSKGKSYIGEPEVSLIALSVKNIPGGTDLQKNIALAKLKPDDVVLCFTTMVKSVDRYNRNGAMRGLMVLSSQDTNKITSEAWSDPKFLFQLIRSLNGDKPLVTKANGTKPAEISSTKINFLANAKWGGPLKETATRDIPPTVNPTQILLR